MTECNSKNLNHQSKKKLLKWIMESTLPWKRIIPAGNMDLYESSINVVSEKREKK
uniref:Uncharacterized protein n=1 Tax=Octopus bimaculoides TaxID=37653 RepID=A0A0L8IC41_OCTBM